MFRRLAMMFRRFHVMRRSGGAAMLGSGSRFGFRRRSGAVCRGGGGMLSRGLGKRHLRAEYGKAERGCGDDLSNGHR